VSFPQTAPERARVAVLLDYQNVLQRGHYLYGHGKETYQCVPEPSLIADTLAGKRDTWEPRDGRVRVVSHPLFHRNWPDDAPVEKGVDVSLAIELVRMTLQDHEQYDALIGFSSDTDLRPALKLCRELGGPVIEVACWTGANPLQDPATHLPYCHFLNENAWKRIVRDWTGRI
jgi:hypothetical protein